MNLESQLARDLVRRHPARAAAVLERMTTSEVVPFLAAIPAAETAAVLARMPPLEAASMLASLGETRAAQALDTLPLDVVSRLLRRLDGSKRQAVLAQIPPKTSSTLQTLLAFPENTAGALMDPGILALASDLSAREALRRVREASEYAQYNLYVVDREQRLVGVLNLRELLRARPRALLADVMVRNPARLDAQADRSVILGHPAWRDVRAIPVVDEHGGYLGAVRYRVVRQLEEELLGRRAPEVATSEALGDLFAAGAAGVLDALTGPPGDGGRREED